jgi:hypothetical protein
MERNPSPDYITSGKWRVRDLLHHIHIHIQTGRKVPYPTIKRWRKHLDIDPDSDMLYTDCDLDGLVVLARWLDRGGKVKPFATRFKLHSRRRAGRTNHQHHPPPTVGRVYGTGF